jgi:hypothetical protein
MPFAVYTDGYASGNHYVPSGYKGDTRTIVMNQSWTRDPHTGKSCIQVKYHGPVPGGQGWADVYWQNPPNNWGTAPGPTGYNLSHATRLTFCVRGRTGHERIQFLVGGITGKHGDSLRQAVKTPWLMLSTTWQPVTIPLAGRNLTHIIGGFGWVANITNDPNGATFYLDDITYSAAGIRRVCGHKWAALTGAWGTAAPMPTASWGMASSVIGATIFIVGGATGLVSVCLRLSTRHSLYRTPKHRTR